MRACMDSRSASREPEVYIVGSTKCSNLVVYVGIGRSGRRLVLNNRKRAGNVRGFAKTDAARVALETYRAAMHRSIASGMKLSTKRLTRSSADQRE